MLVIRFALEILPIGNIFTDHSFVLGNGNDYRVDHKVCSRSLDLCHELITNQ